MGLVEKTLAAMRNLARRFAEAGTPGAFRVLPPDDLLQGAAESAFRRRYQPRLTGLQIRALRTRKRAGATHRMGRSKYEPHGFPCWMTHAMSRV